MNESMLLSLGQSWIHCETCLHLHKGVLQMQHRERKMAYPPMGSQSVHQGTTGTFMATSCNHEHAVNCLLPDHSLIVHALDPGNGFW